MGKGIITSTISGSSTGTGIDGLTITGSVTILGGDSSAAIGTYALSASSNISASAFYGDGSNLSNVTGDARSVAGDTDNAVITWVTSDNTFAAEAGITFASDELHLTADSSVIKLGDGSDATLTHDGTTGVTLAANPITLDSAGDITLDADGANIIFKDGGTTIGSINNNSSLMELSGTAGGVSIIGNNASDVTIDSSQDIILDADGGDLIFKDGGTGIGAIKNTSSNLIISASVANKDIMFIGSDDVTATTALTLDMSDAGTALFANDVSLASDSSVLKFGAGGDVTFTHDGGEGMGVVSEGGLTFSSTTGSISMTVVDGQTLLLGKAAASSLTLTPHGTAGSELAVLTNNAGTTDGSQSSEGVAGGAVAISATAGGIGLSWADGKDLWAEGGRAVITANENAADCILLHGDAGANQTIRVLNDAGTNAAAIALTSTAGGITLTVNSSKLVTISGGDLVPGANGTLDLGGSSARWANIYTSDMNFANDRGDWTLIEENDFISFRNNHTGRRFKMLMEDITDTGDYGPDIDGNM